MFRCTWDPSSDGGPCWTCFLVCEPWRGKQAGGCLRRRRAGVGRRAGIVGGRGNGRAEFSGFRAGQFVFCARDCVGNSCRRLDPKHMCTRAQKNQVHLFLKCFCLQSCGRKGRRMYKTPLRSNLTRFGLSHVVPSVAVDGGGHHEPIPTLTAADGAPSSAG